MNRIPDNSSKSDGPSTGAIDRAAIIESAIAQVRRFGEAKTNVVDIARAMGASHTALYRHFRSKAEIFDAIVLEAMADEEQFSAAYLDGPGAASKRLEAMVVALHETKRARLSGDREVFDLYKRVLAERPEIIVDYTARMTRLVAGLIGQGVASREFKISDVEAAAVVVRDAVTVYLHPAHLETAALLRVDQAGALQNTVRTLCAGFRAGVSLTS